MEEALYNWLLSVTGLDVYAAPLNNATDKPSGDYATYQIIAMVMSDFNQNNAVVKDADFITKTSYNNATMSVSINIFSDQGYSIITDLNNSADFWESRNLLKQGGITINRFGNPQNLTGLGDTNFVTRWQADIEMRIAIENQYDWDRLKEIQLGGSFSTVDNSQTIVSVSQWPKP